MTYIQQLIDSVVVCIKCGAKGIGTCDCWTMCERCGWSYESGGVCTRCQYLATNETVG